VVRSKLPVSQENALLGKSPIPRDALEAGWAFLDHLPFPIIEIMEDYSVGRANRASTDFYGAPKGKCYELSHARDVPCDQAGEACPKSAATEKCSHVAVRHAHATTDGVQMFLVSAYPLEHGGILEFHLPIEETLARDGLTGLYTRDFFDQLLGRQRALLARMNLEYSIVMMDIDNFKRINDEYGHPVGDLVLREFGALLRSERRDGDSIGRYGGEEFCVFMPGADSNGAKAYVARLQAAIRALRVDSDTDTIDPTASFGVWSGAATIVAADAIKAADEALYEAKRAGRDCIRIAAEPRQA